MRRKIVFATTLLLLTACSSGDDEADSITLEGQEQAPDPEGEEAGDALEPSGEAEAQGADEEAAEQGSGAADGTELVDLTEAIPGTWPVGDAGTVTFSIVDGELSLDDVVPAQGWSFHIDEQDPDEIEVDFRQGNVEWEIEIELEDGASVLEIEIDQDIENADTGSYDIGDAGTFAFDVQDGDLVLTDLNVNDGWSVTEQDEEAEEIEIELVNGPREFDVEIELKDDGTIEVEIDYEVVGPVAG